MIKVNTLHSLENISDYYYFDTENFKVLNIFTNTYKTVCINKRGYPVVYLQRKDRVHQQNVPMHKIVALAMIHNGPYKLIEHLNDDKMDYRPENLAFSTQKNNILRAFDNGLRVCKARIFRVELMSGSVFEGTMRQISKESKIAMGTLYDNLIYKSMPNGECVRSRKIKSIVETGQQTIERHGIYEAVNRVE